MTPLRSLVDLLAPPRCPSCGAPATASWCGDCLADLSRLALDDDGRCELAPGVLAVAAYRYEGVVRDTVIDVKLRGRHAPAAAMGALLRARLGLPPPASTCAWTWVPSRRASVRLRGVDLPRVLAGPGARPLLRRARATPEQKRLAAAQRREQQRGAFVAPGPVPARVVLVDDVRVTGATTLAAAEALREAGARRVLVATFALSATPPPQPPRSPHDRVAGGTGRSW